MEGAQGWVSLSPATHAMYTATCGPNPWGFSSMNSRSKRICRPFWLFLAPDNATSGQFLDPEIAETWQFKVPVTAVN